MNYKNIESSISEIKTKIQKNRIKEAFGLLESFINKIGNDDLSDELTQLVARYNRGIKENMTGVSEGEEGENKILRSFLYLIREAKEVAMDKVAINTGNKLEELTDRGTRSIENLERINLMIAKSRILELEVMTNGAASMLLSEEHKNKLNNCIRSFQDVVKEIDPNYS